MNHPSIPGETYMCKWNYDNLPHVETAWE
jgi:hypothetical protein